ncbi:hypothetical protein ACFYO7_29705 [Nocardia salmonicida]|uniref:hypothetical protein n=1 Tax=Nocardia salmonicida TaxID=53431 RepID=UPI0036A1619C
METFTQATLLRKQRAEMSNRTRSQRERTTTIRSGNIYLFRGRIHCDICGRKMQAEILRDAVYYRCRARTLAPGSPVQAAHPATINLREAELIEPLDHWLSTLFDQHHLDETIATLLAAQDNDGADTRRAALQRRIEQAQTRIGRHLAAIEAGIDPHVVVEALNSAQADKAAAQVELNNVPAAQRFTEKEVRKLIESLGDVGLVLAGGAPEHKQELYNAIELQVRYAHLEHRATLKVTPVGANVRVRRGT